MFLLPTTAATPTPTTGDTPITTAPGAKTEAFSDDLKFAVQKI